MKTQGKRKQNSEKLSEDESKQLDKLNKAKMDKLNSRNIVRK